MITNIAKCHIGDYVSVDGFCILNQDQRKLLVCRIEEVRKLGSLFSRNVEAGIAFVIPNKESIFTIPLSGREIVIENNTNLFFAGYDPEIEQVRLFSGIACERINPEDGTTTFVFNDNEFLKHPARPVFTENSAGELFLAGVISSSLERIVLMDDLFPDRGGKQLISANWGQFKGLEQGKPGSGPRAILINGPNVQERKYKLEFLNNGNYLNPHHDETGYNAENGKRKPTLYQTALQELVDANFPEELEFVCYNSTYRAKNE